MMDKKLYRTYADQALNISPSHGLLHAEQVNYIVRSAVRNIGHHRILILYVYAREQAVKGDMRPVWTMFQHGQHDYITLARKDDGSTVWREACFERLGNDYNFVYKCAFYSQADEARVCAYFGSAGRGFDTLRRVQYKIQEARARQRHQRRDKQILARMKPLKALPRGLKSWLRKSVMPGYFFYDYQKGRRTVKGVCSACGKDIELTGVKYNAKAVCPCCKRELTMKSRGRRGYLRDQDTCQVIQRVGPDEVVVRIVKVAYTYSDDTPRESLWENARIFVRLDEKGAIRADSYYYSYGHHELTPWKHGERPVFSHYQYNFEADTCGHVYCGNLHADLAGTPWQYCPVELFYAHFHERMQLVPFLAAHIEHPRFEHLVKVGFYELAGDLAYRDHDTHTLDETQNRTHRILQVAPEDVAFLRELDVGLSTLRAFQRHSHENLKDRQALFRWTNEHHVTHDIDHTLPHVTVHRLLRYMDSQYSFLCLRKTQYGSVRYRDMQALVSEYRDYLDMCVKENYDMHSDFILFPKDLQKSHDMVAGRIKHKANAKMRRDFKAVYRRISNQLDYEHDGLKIVYPATPEDIVAEGHALHHCVGGYVDRVARKECMILFLRRCEDISTPYYTIEVRGQEVTQLRGKNNGEATPEVKKFIDLWSKDVLEAPALAKAG